MEAGGTEDECIAALLHDAVEDQGGARTAGEIDRRFGARVAGIVAACTEERSQGMTWKARKSAAIRTARSADASARLVLSADKLHNARSLAADCRRDGKRVWKRFGGGREGTIWYYTAMAGALSRAGGGPLQDELERAVRALRDLAEGRAPR